MIEANQYGYHIEDISGHLLYNYSVNYGHEWQSYDKDGNLISTLTISLTGDRSIRNIHEARRNLDKLLEAVLRGDAVLP